MAKMEYLVVHTMDCGYKRGTTKEEIFQWHMLPCKNANGTYTYKGKTYQSVDALPDEKIFGLSVKKYQNGRGWSVPGYSDMIDANGKLINIVPYNFDDVIDSAELTNGASGYNSKSRHVVLDGGWTPDGKIKTGKDSNGKYLKITDVYCQEQIDTLVKYIKMQKQMVPSLKVVGHNELSAKTCPNFDVQEFLKDYGLL